MSQDEKKQKILIIEDEEDFVLGLKDAFTFEGYHVISAETGEAGISLAADVHPDLIILDLMLPGMNGYQVCEQVRRRDKIVPILILSARSQENDIVRGLEAGADDYVTKPFSIAELLARVRAIFRRFSALPRCESKLIVIGQAEIDVENNSLSIDGKRMQLGYYETAILQLLAEHRGDVVSRSAILDNIWGFDANPTNRTIDNFILKLRKKVEPDPASPTHILTVYGQGYKLV